MRLPVPHLAVLAAIVLAASGAGCTEFLGRAKNARSGPGDNAVDFLSDASYSKLFVEVDLVDGNGPNEEALRELKSALTAQLKKPGGITVDTSGRVPGLGASHRYTIAEIDAIEKEHRGHYAAGDTAVLYVLYVEGGYSDDGESNKVLGAAYHGSSVVMFKGNVKSITRKDTGLLTTSPFTAEERCVERAVLVHEAGHLLGLVNNGIPMVVPHEDSSSKGHSNNKGSVMYKAVEGSAGILNVFQGGCDQIPYHFDDNDEADMRAAGGK